MAAALRARLVLFLRLMQMHIKWLSVITGTALAAFGLKRRSLGGLAIAGIGSGLVWRGLTMNDHTAGDDDHVSVPYGRGIRVERSVTVNASPEQLYTFWRDFENLPRFMQHLERVDILGGTLSHWVAKGPAGLKAEWDAEIINEVPNELIGWRSVDGSTVQNAGSVHFTPATGGRGTVVKVVLRYDPPGGALGAAIAKLFSEEPNSTVREDLRRLKQLLETGEVATTAGQPWGRMAS
ncbi:MAG TPA: SRPBCC family protein [Thermoanaerobaculia bacterium]|nr:SRPBCC family protein [Thermoanaerobaculia bacterium]